MCHHITVVLAGAFDFDEINRLGKPHSIVLQEAANRFVTRFLKPGEIYFINSHRPCDCGTGLCQFDNESDRIRDENRSLERGAMKRMKLGWSKTKIARWQGQKVHEIERYYGRLSDEAKPDADCRHWAAFGNELFEKTKVTRFGILVHFYSASLATDKAAKERITLSRKKLTANTLFQMKKDTITVFIKY